MLQLKSLPPLTKNTGSTPPVIQPKLKIGQPGDRYEQEADAVANRVMQMPDGDAIHMQPLEEEEETMQMQPIEEEEEELMMSRKAGYQSEVLSDIEPGINALKGRGHPLSSSDRSYYEPKFGYDFSNVNIHTNDAASETAEQLGARAYTLGNNIVFGKGQYNSSSHEGKKLMAHELTHVVQQGQASRSEDNSVQADVVDAIVGRFRDIVLDPTSLIDPVEQIFDNVVATNRAMASRISIPQTWLQALISYAASNPMDGVVLLAALPQFPTFYRGGWIMDLQPNAGAMTLDHSIFTPTGSTISLTTYIHELVHVFQYSLVGVSAFLSSYFGMSAATIAYRWMRGQPTNPMRSSPHENQAYDLAARFRTWYTTTNGTDPSTITV